MKIELRDISGEETPVLVFGCDRCAAEYVVPLEEVGTTHPCRCSSCDTPRYLSYREYVDLQERYAATLLDFTVARLSRSER